MEEQENLLQAQQQLLNPNSGSLDAKLAHVKQVMTFSLLRALPGHACSDS